MPYYQYNSFTNRLKESPYSQPLYPISSHPLDTKNSPKIIWDSINTKPVKTISTSSTLLSIMYPKLLSNFKKFQTNIKKPVYLLGGSPDKILFGITYVSIFGGLAATYIKLYEMTHPVKN